MRKGIYVVVVACLGMLLLETACTEKKPIVVESDSIVVDTIADTLKMDTVAEIISEQPIPKAADELFDDFIYLFCQSRSHQMDRIKWPLKELVNGETKLIQRKQWHMEQLYLPQGYYTLILDSKNDLELPKDTSISHVVVEKILLEEQKIKTYNFDRLEGVWMLTSVSTVPTEENHNAAFLGFYEKFVTDSVFQMESIGESVHFSGPDPDNEFEELEGEITPEQWPAFAPMDLPQDVLYNIVYDSNKKESNQKTFMLRGIANGQEMEMTFKRTNDNWNLVRLVE